MINTLKIALLAGVSVVALAGPAMAEWYGSTTNFTNDGYVLVDADTGVPVPSGTPNVTNSDNTAADGYKWVSADEVGYVYDFATNDFVNGCPDGHFCQPVQGWNGVVYNSSRVTSTNAATGNTLAASPDGVIVSNTNGNKTVVGSNGFYTNGQVVSNSVTTNWLFADHAVVNRIDANEFVASDGSSYSVVDKTGVYTNGNVVSNRVYTNIVVSSDGTNTTAMAAEGLLTTNGTKATLVTSEGVGTTDGTNTTVVTSEGMGTTDGTKTTTVKSSGVKATSGAKSAEVTAEKVVVKNGANYSSVSANEVYTTGSVDAHQVFVDGRDVGTSLAAHDAHLGVLDKKMDKAYEGIAMSLAMESPQVDPGKKFGIAVNWGTFEGENAFAAAGKLRFDNTWSGTAGIGVGSSGTVGGRAGVQAQW